MTAIQEVQRSQPPPPSWEAGRGENSHASLECPLCGSAATRAAFRDNGCTLRVCSNCELFFVDPYPSGARQHEQIIQQSQAIDILDCSARYSGERLYYDRHFEGIASECVGARSILDVGCGTGHLLERFAAWHGLDRAGIELNPEAAELARRTARCEVFEVPLEEFRSERRFDVITMINVFSHVPSFDGMFRSLRAVLRPGGKLILRTSEMSSNVSRWNQVHWGIPDDLHFLGLRTLDFICSRYGFEIVRRLRTPFEDELFRASRWRQMGRSSIQNAAKMAALDLPGALSAAQKLYTHLLGQRLFVSLIVLSPTTEQNKW
ncbi:MAG TPA: class I SAM-dependent methyltransferase [Candidatus Limnocylindrales bacterium]|nr:class I SAM-dependent methyltransferase [Candidatus Limnocylindrales bacterium]